MPAILSDDGGADDETQCLLQHQQESPGPRVITSPPSYNQISPSEQMDVGGGASPTDMFEVDTVADSTADWSTLATGDAEKTFFTVCNGSDVTAASIEVVHDILSDLDADDQPVMSADAATTNKMAAAAATLVPSVSASNSNVILSSASAPDDDEELRTAVGCDCSAMSKPSMMGTSGSLVVDVHIPPETKICKHSVNRSQRCYSDSSQASPKRKIGSSSLKLRLGHTSLDPVGSGMQMLNVDKIETICEMDAPNGGRFRQCSESDLGASNRHSDPVSNEFNLHDDLLQFKQTFFDGAYQYPGHMAAENTERLKSGTLSDVKFDIYDTGSVTDSVDLPGGVEGPAPLPPYPTLPPFSYDIPPCLSASSSTASMPACRICQLPGMEPNNHLISPCRCLGSVRYVHNNCLLKWLEVSSKRRNGPPACELCQYQYLRHKKFVISHWRFPECSLRDKVLHTFFLLSVALMITCAAVTILCFKSEERRKVSHTELTDSEMVTLSCGVLFFLAFFLAMYVEVKAKNTVYQLICKFFYMNHEWSVEEYDKRKDIALRKKEENNT